jgi:hypothetical protein
LIPKDELPPDKNDKEKKEKGKQEPVGLRNVSLGLVSFFTDFSTEMILGMLSLFIVNNLGVTRTLL